MKTFLISRFIIIYLVCTERTDLKVYCNRIKTYILNYTQRRGFKGWKLEYFLARRIRELWKFTRNPFCKINVFAYGALNSLIKCKIWWIVTQSYAMHTVFYCCFSRTQFKKMVFYNSVPKSVKIVSMPLSVVFSNSWKKKN